MANGLPEGLRGLCLAFKESEGQRNEDLSPQLNDSSALLYDVTQEDTTCLLVVLILM